MSTAMTLSEYYKATANRPIPADTMMEAPREAWGWPQVEIKAAANGFYVNKGGYTYVFNTIKQMNKFIGETYTPAKQTKPKRKYTRRSK